MHTHGGDARPYQATRQLTGEEDVRQLGLPIGSQPPEQLRDLLPVIDKIFETP